MSNYNNYLLGYVILVVELLLAAFMFVCNAFDHAILAVCLATILSYGDR